MIPAPTRALTGFRDGQPGVLVAADIAARGIDVDGGVACDQFRAAECARRLCAPDRPNRACRCAGSAVALCSDEERPYLRDIEKRTRCSILPTPLPAAMSVPHNGPIDRPVPATSHRNVHHTSRQALPSAQAAPTQHARRAPMLMSAATRLASSLPALLLAKKPAPQAATDHAAFASIVFGSTRCAERMRKERQTW